jgi:hypothetical protein
MVVSSKTFCLFVKVLRKPQNNVVVTMEDGPKEPTSFVKAVHNFLHWNSDIGRLRLPFLSSGPHKLML